MPIESTISGLLLVFGAGGHGRVVADAAQLTRAWSRVVASDRDALKCQGEMVAGVALAPWSHWEGVPCAVHVAIGDNQARERESLALGLERMVTVRHPASVVSTHATVGFGCFLAALCVVAPRSRLERGVVVNHAAVVDHDTHVGAFSHIAPHAVLGGFAELGRRVLVGSGAIVQPGRKIVSESIIGSGAVVTRDIDEPGVYVGVPARRIA